MHSLAYKTLHSLAKFKPQRETQALACNQLKESQRAHGRAVKLGTTILEPDIVCSYSASKALWDACKLFDEVPDWDVVSATATIGCFARYHQHEEAIYFFSRMLALNIKPNQFTFGTVIPSSTALQDLNSGRQLHACAIKMGLESNVFVGSAVVDFYAKLTSIKEAQKAFEDTHEPNVVSYTTLIRGYLKKERFDDALALFRRMPERNVVSWNAMISGYSQMGYNEEAVNLFVVMLREGMLPNECTFPCAISAVANIAALGMGRSFHGSAVKFLGKFDVFVGNSLVSFYAKCGSMEESLLVFNTLPKKNIVSWNALICGYANHGRGMEAIDFFEKMQDTGLRPNSVTLLGLLLACNHSGLVDKGYSYFNKARVEEPGLLTPEHHACMVDLLSRSGRFKEAEKFLHELPFVPGIGFWKALLGGCRIHSNMELGELAARKILALDPEDVSSYVMLSNAHSAAGRWQSVSMIRKEMREKRMKGVPGSSWIEIRSKVHIFVTGDRNHDQHDEIYQGLGLPICPIRQTSKDGDHTYAEKIPRSSGGQTPRNSSEYGHDS
ncbi:Pentatricopeptide repeat-containing protein, mitochondrial [Vitis vinifera]|uniref:Pentatricopeptide repeat-containing protein, mitochondrial n=1 Tax=Vitis vinifera TaxID=29760 RepID=A0A438IPY6_VITVI|nr:Pentatricopeptide repeat-containing protein, mitochondrial [Vitis vinifera]